MMLPALGYEEPRSMLSLKNSTSVLPILTPCHCFPISLTKSHLGIVTAYFILNRTPDYSVVNKCCVSRVVEEDSSVKRIIDFTVPNQYDL
jgi:hypothetical protein